jgi:hypothetical protein
MVMITTTNCSGGRLSYARLGIGGRGSAGYLSGTSNVLLGKRRIFLKKSQPLLRLLERDFLVRRRKFGRS